MKQEIIKHTGDCPWGQHIAWFDSIDSTNTYAKELALSGAPHGTVIAAHHQTGGRGRMGRSFHSPSGKGIYLSFLLRPECPPQNLMHLTCAVGVAVCDAIENVTGFRPGIKWINDLVAGKQKLGGILTELSTDPSTGLVRSAVVGIGINCSHAKEDFPPELRDIAVSLAQFTGKSIDQAKLLGVMIQSISDMYDRLFSQRDGLIEQYRHDCITIGQTVQVIRADEVRPAEAIDIDSDGGLWVRYPDGTEECVNSGEVSIRGMYGYIS